MIFKQKWFGENITKNDGVFSAEVPGNIQYDYAKAKDWPDYQYSDNCKLFETVEDDIWCYYSDLEFTRNDNETVWFHSDGIDYLSEIIINGKSVLHHEGSFSRIDFEITPYLNETGNKLTVKVFPHPKRADAPVGRSQADHVCKAPVCYGWAWHPRLLVSGIWQDTYIETRGINYINSPTVTYTLSEDCKSADVDFSWECKGDVTVSLFDKNSNTVWSGNDKHLHLENVELWWCNEQGNPAMYTWTMESDDDKKSGKIGFRRSRLVMNEGSWDEPSIFPKSRSDAPATYELNGRKIFLKGSNYVTPDIFTGRVTKDVYEKQISLARDAHMNVFRCWGGCGCQKEEFYDLCDELGIMVWVEFPLACNLYSEDEHYLKILEQEATEILLRLRQHPCIAFWCGGNELFNVWSGMTEQHLALRLLDTLCYHYDRYRPFIMTSPLNGMGHGNYLFFEKPVNNEDNLQTFRRARNTCYTEFGTPSLADKETVEKVIPKEVQIFPVPDDDPSWKAHYGTANDPWRCQADTLEVFPECETLDELLDYSALMQAMSYKCTFEEARRQWPHCSMAINWYYNEPWYSVVNRHIINYDCKPLPAYYAIKDSLRSVLATAGIPKFIWKADEIFTADIVLHNDTLESVIKNVKVTLTIAGETVELLDWKGSCEPLSNKLAPTVRYKLPNISDIRVFDICVALDDGTENKYTLRYFPNKEKPAVRRLNE